MGVSISDKVLGMICNAFVFSRCALQRNLECRFFSICMSIDCSSVQQRIISYRVLKVYRYKGFVIRLLYLLHQCICVKVIRLSTEVVVRAAKMLRCAALSILCLF